MKNLSDDEKKKLYKKFQDAINDAIDNGLLSNLSQTPFSSASLNSFASNYPYPAGISPTDKDARGRFPYQEPEMDEQGTYYGYKVLVTCHCGCGKLSSPRYPAEWLNGALQADREPSERTMFGIHCTKRPDHPELEKYGHSWIWGGTSSVLVKCALSGTIVETEQGFRAEYAQIVGVLENGYWQSYQDYQERTTTNSRRDTIQGWEVQYKTRWDNWNKDKGDWITFDIDPKA